MTLLHPPTPPRPDSPLTFRGFLHAARTNALTIWPKAAYEEPVAVGGFLGRKYILLNAPESIHHVLVGSPGNYRRTRASIRILRPITGQGLLLSEGDRWKLQRRTVAPSLAPRVMPMLAGHVVASAQAAFDRLAVDGPVNLLATMQALALDIAGRSMFSLEMQQHGAAMRALLEEYAAHYAQPRMLDLMLPTQIPSPRDFGRMRFQRRWMGLVETMIQARLEAPAADTPRDLLDLLRSARDPETGAGFSRQELRDQVATLILAGHETTAVTLFWALILLAQAPEEQDRLAAEVVPLSIRPETAHATMAQMTQVKAVVNEALRLFPPAFTVVRESIKADTAGDVALPKGTLVMIAPWVLHRHRGYWPDADAFNPSRFLPDAPPPPRFAFMPFGAGPRVCVGAQFALTEAVLALACFIQRFQIRRLDDRPVLPVGIITTQPDHPAAVALTLRG